jgi:hypothetical protein
MMVFYFLSRQFVASGTNVSFENQARLQAGAALISIHLPY